MPRLPMKFMRHGAAPSRATLVRRARWNLQAVAVYMGTHLNAVGAAGVIADTR
ncbi:hypothetical protein OBBRIDRAFT_796997 [Obba rivulosa]|uniref:Uncharacterized protein n=1 Tax=Obba rivulosa TaxID=1052685 RepID=A0A8E2AR61_9APHY|nr:hypothetical protein OBBRIDRAFT_796997 [Obba rivulosa]